MLRRKIFYVVFLFFMCTVMLNITGCTQVGHVKSLEDYRILRKGFESTEEIDESNKKEEVSEDDNKENNPTASPENNTNDNKTKNNQETKEEANEETETINFEDIKVNPDVSYGYYYDQLSDELKKIYILLMSKMDIISKEYIKITNITFDMDALERAISAVILDDFHYNVSSYQYSEEGNTIFLSLELQNAITSNQKEKAEKKAYDIVKRINSNSEIELVQKIYDWCTKNIVYDESLNKKHNRDLYGALIKKESVCVGYARAFSYMCGLAGIKCINVMNQKHMYNYVQIDSKWYGVDTTGGEPGSHVFLLQGKEFLEIEQHIPSEGFDLPELSEESIFED